MQNTFYETDLPQLSYLTCGIFDALMTNKAERVKNSSRHNAYFNAQSNNKVCSRVKHDPFLGDPWRSFL